jgi:hypothetical protein
MLLPENIVHCVGTMNFSQHKISIDDRVGFGHMLQNFNTFGMGEK